jgi:hypothetical protein
MEPWRPGADHDEIADAVLVIPPPSPSDTNPPLGPAIIARAAERAGFSTRVIDLNALHISRFRGTLPSRDTLALGDHGKDRPLVAQAARWLYDVTGLYNHVSEYLPEGADPVAGMHYPWKAISAATLDQCAEGTWWEHWLSRDLFGRFPRPPLLLGVSVMGASQVFPALVVFTLAKKRWPGTVMVAGGSHITLLANLIRTDPRYRKGIDLILPGHSEDSFVNMLRQIKPDAPRSIHASPAIAGNFEYLPLFSAEQLGLYGRENLTIPVQFTRGCAYARCTFCTYPAVEPFLTRFDPARAQAAVSTLIADHGMRRFSVKDSLFTVPMMESFARALIASAVEPVAWSATTKAARRLALVAPLLAESGLATVELGIESINTHTQKLFDKRADLAMIEDVILALAAQRVLVVINLIFGAPGETIDDAERQLAWYNRMRDRAPGYIDGSLNLLEIVRGSPMESMPPPGVTLSGVAPWAYCYKWNAPGWRPGFAGRLRAAELARRPAPAATGSQALCGDLVSGGQPRSS